jgi:hypothetical protein
MRRCCIGKKVRSLWEWLPATIKTGQDAAPTRKRSIQMKERSKENEKNATFRCHRISNGVAKSGPGFLRDNPCIDG